MNPVYNTVPLDEETGIVKRKQGNSSRRVPDITNSLAVQQGDHCDTNSKYNSQRTFFGFANHLYIRSRRHLCHPQLSISLRISWFPLAVISIPCFVASVYVLHNAVDRLFVQAYALYLVFIWGALKVIINRPDKGIDQELKEVYTVRHNQSNVSDSYLESYSEDYLQSLFEDEFNTNGLLNDLGEDKTIDEFESSGNLTLSSSSSAEGSCLIELRALSSSSLDEETGSRRCTMTIGCNHEIDIKSDTLLQERSYSQERFQHCMKYTMRQNITSCQRGLLINWVIEMARILKMSSDSLHFTIGLIDRCLASCTFVKTSSVSLKVDKKSFSDAHKNILIIDRKSLHLLGCTCLWIACKLHERIIPRLPELHYLTDSTYDNKQILQMERDICASLDFNFRVISPFHFSNILLLRQQTSELIGSSLKFLTEYLLEIAALSPDFIYEPPSEVAASAIYLAHVTLHSEELSSDDEYNEMCSQDCQKILQDVCDSDQKIQDLKRLVLQLYEQYLSTSSGFLLAPFEKYKSRSYDSVAFVTPVEPHILDKCLESLQIPENAYV